MKLTKDETKTLMESLGDVTTPETHAPSGIPYLTDEDMTQESFAAEHGISQHSIRQYLSVCVKLGEYRVESRIRRGDNQYIKAYIKTLPHDG